MFYRNPFGAVTTKTEVTIRIGIAEGGIPRAVTLVYVDKDKKENRRAMYYITQIGDFCIYETIIPKQEKCGNVFYCFDIECNNERVYYSNNGKSLGGEGCIYREPPHTFYQITVYSPEYITPRWWRNSVCYQIFCDRFFNGNDNGEFSGGRSDIIKRQWEDMPFYKPEQFGGEYLANDFFGGNLKGIIKKLDYLSELGVGAIYLNPIFKAYSNHKYDTGDYMKIDEMFGDKETFFALCKRAEELGIRIILDGVFNHTGCDSLYFNKLGRYDSVGAYESEGSEYRSWFKFSDENDDYESWWGIKTLPAVNKQSDCYRDFIYRSDNSVVRHWLKCGACGWRLDVVDELPGFFVKELREAVKKENPEAVIIGEVWEDASNKVSYGEEREYFLGDELDSVMNYPLRDAVVDVCTGKIDAEEFDKRLMSIKENYPRPAFYSLLNMLSSHDTERILTAMSGTPDRRCTSKEFQAGYRIDGELLRVSREREKLAVMLVMLLPGVPCIYYGDEAGLQGYGDPFCRNTYPWGKEDADMLDWYKKSIKLRKSNNVYCDGELETVYKIGTEYGFIRYSENEKRVALFCFGDKSSVIRVDLAKFGVRFIESEFCDETYSSNDGIFYIELPPHGVKVFRCG